MPWSEVTPVLLDHQPGELCCKRYAGHPRGCPNYGNRATCPPHAAVWTPEYIGRYRWVAIWNVFPFGEHVEKMRAKHPDWTERQLANCLYWQGTARKQLTQAIRQLFDNWPRELGPRRPVECDRIPEAHGVNVTATMASLGVPLEWPPKTVTYQVALVRLPVEGHSSSGGES